MPPAAKGRSFAERKTTLFLDKFLVGQRHFDIDLHGYKHDAPASEPERKSFTRLRVVLVCGSKVALSN